MMKTLAFKKPYENHENTTKGPGWSDDVVDETSDVDLIEKIDPKDGISRGC